MNDHEHTTASNTWRVYINDDGKIEIDNLVDFSMEVKRCPFCGFTEGITVGVCDLKEFKY